MNSPYGRYKREHVNGYGQPKFAYHNELAAEMRAVEMNDDRRRSPELRGLGPVEAYRCRFCRAWHVGTASVWRRRPQPLADELGPRAWSNLAAENVGRLERRLGAILSRFEAVRKRLAVHNSCTSRKSRSCAR